MEIHWKRCHSYDEAKSALGIVYLHEWNGKPFYWGICDTSVFGGNARVIEGVKRNPRYGSSYRHWIEGCLRNGGKLYIGTPSGLGLYSLMDVERTLIALYPSEMNDEADKKVVVEDLQHLGDVPLSIRSHAAQ